MSYNWKKHVKHSSKKNTDKRVAKHTQLKLLAMQEREVHFLSQQNAEMKQMILNITRKWRD
tara:strand:- start:167 stop:349 length:183 start_codon:yes stop_codon:yes gene_type:complete